MKQTLCGYNRFLCYNNKEKVIKFKSKCRYHDKPCNRMVQNNEIWLQTSDTNHKRGRNYMVN